MSKNMLSQPDSDKIFRTSDLNYSQGSASKKFSTLRSYDSRDDKENTQNASFAYGSRDVLLVKCKQAIEELHVELEDEKKIRNQNEETILRLEKETLEKEAKIRDLQYKEEKLTDEVRSLTIKLSSLMETNNHLEHQVKISSSNEISFLELQDNFHNVCRANNELKSKVEELSSEIKKRDKVVNEWNDTLESIDAKISGLEVENTDLKRDRETLINETENMRILLRESENLNSLLQNKCEYIEKITKQLESENKIIETLKMENENLRHEYSKNLRHTETIAEEQKLTIIQYEQKFLRDKEIIERTVKDKYEGKLKEFQLEMHGELNKFRDLNQKINEDLASTKVERDHYKEEIKQLRDKMQQIDNEQRRWTSSLSDKYENMLKSKQDEIEKVRNIIDEQSHLIKSYEKIIEKEKGASLERINDFASENNQLKQDIYDLTTKNNYLNAKLQECQEELVHIQGEIKSTFSQEEEKQNKLIRRMGELDKLLSEKNLLIDNLTSDISKLKDANKRKKIDLETGIKSKKEVSDELSRAQNQILDLINENELLKDKQKDFYALLQTKIDEISRELKTERERRINAESTCKDQEERILELEMQTKKNFYNPHQTETTNEYRRNRSQGRRVTSSQEFTNNSFKAPQAEPTTYKTYQTQESPNVMTFNSDSKDKNYSFSRPEKNVTEFGSHAESRHYSTGFGNQERDSRPPLPSQDPEQVHSQFLSRFRTVISKLENRLEKITNDMDS